MTDAGGCDQALWSTRWAPCRPAACSRMGA